MSGETGLERLDSFAYRHRVAEVMGTPLATARPGATIAEASRTMAAKGISSLVVVDERGRPVGIITERDVLKAVATHRREVADVPVGTIMSSPVATIRSDAFSYVAMGRMDRLRVRHLVAVDEHGIGVGMVTVRGLMKMRSSYALLVGDEVDAATNPQDMLAAKMKLPRLAGELLAERVEALGVARVLTSVLRALSERSARMAEQSMIDKGWGAAPAPWSLLLLGSGGRRESLFGADQDNAIVHAGSRDDDPWFAELGKRICDTLDAAGVPFCNGGVMACNTEWRHNQAGWEDRITQWIREADGKELLNVHIFVDFRPVYGDIDLAARLRAYLRDQAAKSPRFLHAMAQAAGDIKAPLGVLGQFITKDGRLDLKMSGLLPLTSAARILALKHRIDATGTGERLRALAEGGHMSAVEAASLQANHELMVRILLEQQQADLAAGIATSNRIDPKRLAPDDRDRLKQTFKTINALNWVMKNALSSV
ncbi:putative signal transduction protein [Magnetospirillum sp. LM-5]|uniref:putative nucleotidyltransferase substrate binding domain-containing protein n=1 Tax=Magnetospirillum sp. LM-5 TaxID=2681466 RepID=UPI00138137A8|nr:putative nucleotidyltransferase substrate binding domain-containing protein [Magnetospirillum sp. LM-5]CAA7623787.1 putative signal transduction protein [Magnetospirillum sp. LM-5]